MPRHTPPAFHRFTTRRPRLIAALHEVERELGRPRATRVAQPKTSWLSPFFRASGVSGMLAPFYLETLLNPDLTGPERPSVLAHEWAHLSGYAPESDASFVGYLAALRAGPAAEYSAWLDLVSEAANQLQPVTQRLVLEKLEAGPRRDQDAIRERLKALVQPVETVAWSTYDQMLKSQGVDEGVQSYSRVVQLLIGTDALKTAALKFAWPTVRQYKRMLSLRASAARGASAARMFVWSVLAMMSAAGCTLPEAPSPDSHRAIEPRHLGHAVGGANHPESRTAPIARPFR